MSVNFDENIFDDTEDYDVNGMEMPVSKEELANGSKQMRECDESWLYIFAFVKAFANKENVPFRLEDWDSLKLIASVSTVYGQYMMFEQHLTHLLKEQLQPKSNNN